MAAGGPRRISKPQLFPKREAPLFSYPPAGTRIIIVDVAIRHDEAQAPRRFLLGLFVGAAAICRFYITAEDPALRVELKRRQEVWRALWKGAPATSENRFLAYIELEKKVPHYLGKPPPWWKGLLNRFPAFGDRWPADDSRLRDCLKA